MPRNTDYQKCVMYSIQNRVLGLEYIGHTTNFIARKAQHKFRCNKGDETYKIYKIIRENGGWDTWEMIIICEYPCENLTQARIEEERLRIERNATLNDRQAYTIPQEYAKQYYIKNKEIRNEKYKEYRQKYREENKDKIKEYRKYYHETFGK